MDDSARITATKDAIDQLKDALSAAVSSARDRGASWDGVAEALGVARQSAWRRFKDERRMKAGQRRCSFCGRRQKHVAHLVAAPTGACICDECLDVAVSMVDADRRSRK